MNANSIVNGMGQTIGGEDPRLRMVAEQTVMQQMAFSATIDRISALEQVLIDKDLISRNELDKLIMVKKKEGIKKLMDECKTQMNVIANTVKGGQGAEERLIGKYMMHTYEAVYKKVEAEEAKLLKKDKETK